MKGRYEKPKQKGFGKKNQSIRPDSRYNYRENTGYSSGDMGDYGRTDYSCGSYPEQQDYYDPAAQKRSFGFALLGFLLPLVGLILFFCMKKKKPGKARSAGKGALIGFLVSLVLCIVLGAVAYVGVNSYMKNMFDKVNQVEVTVSYTQPAETEVTEAETQAVVTTEPPHVASRDDYINILVAGQSSRGADDKEQARFADSMMLVTINTYEKTMTITSLLRDAFVKMPDYKGHTGGRIKLTTVYHLGYQFAGNQIAGSMEAMNLCLYNNFGIEVDYNFEIDFNMFEKIINRLGGVTVVLDEAEARYMTKTLAKYDTYGTISAGPYPLDGFSGLVFARMRHADGDGDSDIKRTGRQQRFVKALLEKVSHTSISDLQAIANDVLPMISTSMNSQQMADLMKLLLPMLPELKLVSGGTCPANYKGELVDIYKDGFKHSVLKFDEKETKERMRELTLGELPPSGVSALATEPMEITDPTLPPETTAAATVPSQTTAAATVPAQTQQTVPATYADPLPAAG